MEQIGRDEDRVAAEQVGQRAVPLAGVDLDLEAADAARDQVDRLPRLAHPARLTDDDGVHRGQKTPGRHGLGPVVGALLLIGGEEQGELAGPGGGHQALDGHHHGGHRPLHVGGPEPVGHLVDDRELERWGVPLRPSVTDRLGVQVPGQREVTGAAAVERDDEVGAAGRDLDDSAVEPTLACPGIDPGRDLTFEGSRVLRVDRDELLGQGKHVHAFLPVGAGVPDDVVARSAPTNWIVGAG